jgi:hypothetical protein
MPYRMGELASEDSYDPFAAEQFVNPAVKAVMGGLADTVKVPGQMMAPNPYPPGSEEASFYDASKTAKAVDWAPGMALNTMGTGAIAGVPVKGGEQVFGAGFVGRKLPADNYTGPVSRYTDELFREMSPREAIEGLPTSVVYGSPGMGGGRKFYADQPELALGQGSNRGVRVTYDAAPFEGQINKKPGWEALFPEGSAEYTAAPTSNIRDAVKGFEINPSSLSQVEVAQYQRLLTNLEQQGWNVNRTADKITVTRPSDIPKMGATADLATYPASTGSRNPLANVEATFRGKQPSTLTPEEWHAWGQEHGVENLGPLSPLQTYKDMQGKDFQVPGGTEGNWTYYDLLHMKANPINPANVDRELHGELQRKLGRTMTPTPLDDAQVWNGLTFGMTSPNNPLFPNQVTASRLRLRDPQMLDDLSSMIPWKAGEEVTAQQRKVVNDAIANRFSLDAAGKGGLGTRGTADYSRIGELAQMFKQNPDFFRKAPGEDWGQAVERISSQVPGLSMKTGSFGTVWQDPAHAAISAIDRHMARALEERGGLFETPAARTDWENRGVGLWNKRNPDNPVTNWSDLMTKSGSDGFVGEMLLSHVGAAENPLFRVKGGGVNPNIPQHLAQADWVREPDKVFKMGAAYKRALEENQKLADASGLNLFMSQWLEWDRIRNRFEPHENMFPGLSKMPAMSVEQMRLVDDAHRATGHKTYTKTPEGLLPPTRPLGMNPSAMGYLGVGGAAAAPVLGSILNDQEYRQ